MKCTRNSEEVLVGASISNNNEQVDAVSQATIRSTATDFNVKIQLDVEIDEPYFQRQWVEAIPRFLI